MTALPQSPNVTLKAIHNGPYQIKGPIQLVDHDGRSYDLTGRRSVLLCRCGHSANKPFCDGQPRQAELPRRGTRGGHRKPPPSRQRTCPPHDRPDGHGGCAGAYPLLDRETGRRSSRPVSPCQHRGSVLSLPADAMRPTRCALLGARYAGHTELILQFQLSRVSLCSLVGAGRAISQIMPDPTADNPLRVPIRSRLRPTRHPAFVTA